MKLAISEKYLLELATRFEDAARAIQDWGDRAPSYFRTKNRITPEVERFREYGAELRTLVEAHRCAQKPVQPGE